MIFKWICDLTAKETEESQKKVIASILNFLGRDLADAYAEASRANNDVSAAELLVSADSFLSDDSSEITALQVTLPFLWIEKIRPAYNILRGWTAICFYECDALLSVWRSQNGREQAIILEIPDIPSNQDLMRRVKSLRKIGKEFLIELD